MNQLALALLLLPLPALANEPVIKIASAQKSGNTWYVSVTLSHPDSGWDHYADGWEVLDGDDNPLAYRLLAHPHVQEQPFTRALSGVKIPAGLDTVYIRSHCLIDGWGKQRFEVKF